MPAPGQFKPPVVPLRQAVERVSEIIDNTDGDVAVFMIAGRVVAAKKGAPYYEAKVARLKNNLIGVYNIGVDSRQLADDIGVFYRMCEVRWK